MATKDLKERTQALVAAFCEGSDAAYSELYNMYVNILYNYGMRLTQDEELLKDCIHDVFLKVYSKRSERSVIKNFASYVVISMKNRLLDEFRHLSFDSDNAAEAYTNRLADDDVEKSFLAMEQEQTQTTMVALLLHTLTPRQREAITLYYLEGRKYPEICQMMQMNYHSVRNLMHRGMLKLRESAVNFAATA